jgi:hypothetical protein
MGTLKEPNARAMLLSPSATANAPSPECAIKGDITRSGRRIYHTQNQKTYVKIRLNKAGKRWFCTTEEAETAGWRRALR